MIGFTLNALQKIMNSRRRRRRLSHEEKLEIIRLASGREKLPVGVIAKKFDVSMTHVKELYMLRHRIMGDSDCKTVPRKPKFGFRQ